MVDWMLRYLVFRSFFFVLRHMIQLSTRHRTVVVNPRHVTRYTASECLMQRATSQP